MGGHDVVYILEITWMLCGVQTRQLEAKVETVTIFSASK